MTEWAERLKLIGPVNDQAAIDQAQMIAPPVQVGLLKQIDLARTTELHDLARSDLQRIVPPLIALDLTGLERTCAVLIVRERSVLEPIDPG
jgi:hypothetical protein